MKWIMDKRMYEYLEIENLKEMLEKTGELYADKKAYKIKKEEDYITYTHKEVREMINALGTSLINMGLKGKRIAVIGNSSFEWEMAYLSVVCGTGIIVPLDKSLTDIELANLIAKSEVQAIFCQGKYIKPLEDIKNRGIGKLKNLISMDLEQHKNGVYSQKELIEEGKKLIKQGDRRFLDAEINAEEMSIMLFTSGTTSAPKVVALSHKNICSNLMDIGSILDVNSDDVFLSVLPIHHVFECTVGFLFALYKGAMTVFCDGIRYISKNLKEHKVSVMACVPSIYEKILKMIKANLQKEGKLSKILEDEEKYKELPIEQRKEKFKEIQEILGGNIKLLISGAASLERSVEREYRLLGFNLVQGYGLTETSPVVAIGTNKYHKIGSIGKSVPSVDAKIVDVNKEGIGELAVKGPSIMIGYYNNKKATDAVLEDGWFYTGDLARIDDEGYIFICGRKKSVIVLKNGKNIFPEELENLINRIEGVNESFIFGKQMTNDKDDIKINVKVVIDKEKVKDVYKVKTEEEIYQAIHSKIKEINKIIPQYKAIRGMIITEEPLIKTTTNKIKRQENLKIIEENNK